jgi:hypothetical protein
MRPVIVAASAVMLAAFSTPSGATIDTLNCFISKPDQTTYSDCRERPNFSRKAKHSSYKPKEGYPQKPKEHYKKPNGKYKKDCDRECKEHLAKKFKYLHDKKKALLAKLYWKKKYALKKIYWKKQYVLSKLYWKKKSLLAKLHKEPNHKSPMGGYGSSSIASSSGFGGYDSGGSLTSSGGTLSNTVGDVSRTVGGAVSSLK